MVYTEGELWPCLKYEFKRFLNGSGLPVLGSHLEVNPRQRHTAEENNCFQNVCTAKTMTSFYTRWTSTFSALILWLTHWCRGSKSAPRSSPLRSCRGCTRPGPASSAGTNSWWTPAAGSGHSQNMRLQRVRQARLRHYVVTSLLGSGASAWPSCLSVSFHSDNSWTNSCLAITLSRSFLSR